MKRTTATQARDIAKQCTEHVIRARGGQITETWDENPTKWWSNVYSHAAIANEYFETLVDTIIDMRIRANDFENPLAQYKSGDLPSVSDRPKFISILSRADTLQSTPKHLSRAMYIIPA